MPGVAQCADEAHKQGAVKFSLQTSQHLRSRFFPGESLVGGGGSLTAGERLSDQQM